MSFSSFFTLKSWVLDVTWEKEKGNFTSSKKNPHSVPGKLKHPTDLLAWVFIVSFYS